MIYAVPRPTPPVHAPLGRPVQTGQYGPLGAASFKRFDFKRHPLLLLLPPGWLRRPSVRPCGFRLVPRHAGTGGRRSRLASWRRPPAAFEVRLIFYQSARVRRSRRRVVTALNTN